MTELAEFRDQDQQTSDWEAVTIPARDSYPLAGFLRIAPAGDGPVVIMNSATAVQQQFYRKFADHLINAGAYAVLTYDYRGIGLSAPEKLRGFKARIRDWAFLDMPAAVDWMEERFPGRPLVGAGHSVGGHGLGLMDNGNRYLRYAKIASQLAYFKYMKNPWLLYTQMVIVGLPLTAAIGYLPAGMIGNNPPMPRTAYAEWANWFRKPGYMFDDPSMNAAELFARFERPILSVRLSDDPWGTAEAVEALNRRFVNADVRTLVLTPEDGGGGPVGHMGFFREKHGTTLWPRVSGWLLSGH